MKITTNGRVTIPAEIRRRFDIQAGTKIHFVGEGNAVKMIPVGKTAVRGQHLVEPLRGNSTVRMTTDEILNNTRGEG